MGRHDHRHGSGAPFSILDASTLVLAPETMPTNASQDASVILAPISLGELIDKITILRIKRRHIAGVALDNVKQELHALETILQGLGFVVDALLVQRLAEINAELWAIENTIRDHEGRQCFDDSFVRLARLAYKTNDERAAIKRQINAMYGSALVEEKAYKVY